ncbi:D-tyrosyl-tRNA(Tyr) deacylase [Candidatus Fermentibacteria bacterium]|nr:D-tyrosyl-tRNA(Tyr) deacylase [Candidatus Fermentibacteria bacterium]
MKTLLQRVSRASVGGDGESLGSIGRGLLVLAGFRERDDEEELRWMAGKIVNLRIFPDSGQNMNLSLLDVDGQLLVVSQFTLHASCRKGRRPSFVKAAPPSQAETLYDIFLQELRGFGVEVESGRFGAMMEVELVNSGPVTIMVESPSERSGA